MRHRKARNHLNRFTSWRKATLRGMGRALVLHQSIKTTLAKAKAGRPLVEELISLAKANTLAAKRKAFSILGEHKLVKILFDEVGPRFSERKGGYTRIINLGTRRGDNAKTVIFEFTEILKKEKKVIKKHKEEKPHGAVHEADKEGQAAEEKKTAAATQVIEKPPLTKKPAKKFLGGIKSIFKKKSDSL